MFTAHSAESEHPPARRVRDSAQYAASPKKCPFRLLT
jgi:hypothetical protein